MQRKTWKYILSKIVRLEVYRPFCSSNKPQSCKAETVVTIRGGKDLLRFKRPSQAVNQSRRERAGSRPTQIYDLEILT